MALLVPATTRGRDDSVAAAISHVRGASISGSRIYRAHGKPVRLIEEAVPRLPVEEELAIRARRMGSSTAPGSRSASRMVPASA